MSALRRSLARQRHLRHVFVLLAQQPFVITPRRRNKMLVPCDAEYSAKPLGEIVVLGAGNRLR